MDGRRSLRYNNADLFGLMPRRDAWRISSVLGNAFTVKTTLLVPGKGENQQCEMLRRTVAWTREGITYTHDARHARLLAEMAGRARPVDIPAVRVSAKDHEMRG